MNSLPTPELVEVATRAAEAFALPAEWREGRLPLAGYAIDALQSADCDDAVALAETADGDELQVSVTDTGAFLRAQPRIAQLAWRRIESHYQGSRAVLPMIPPSISEDKLSLSRDEERPVVTIHLPAKGALGQSLPRLSRGILRATRLDYAEVTRLIDSDEDAGVALRALEKVARQLLIARHKNHQDVPEQLDDEEADRHQVGRVPVGRIIVEEAMIAANAAMAHFMHHHEIPALYWNYTQLDEIAREVHAPDSIARKLLASGWYEQEPHGHEGLRLEKYLHFTSPLRRFPDFVNHANLAAFLDDQPYPYDSEALDKIASRIHSFTLREVERHQRQRVAQKAAQIQVNFEQSAEKSNV